MTSKFFQDLNNFLSTTIPGYSLAESVIDNLVRDTVTPVTGSILHCSLYGAEHSGIYIGDGQVVELQGKLGSNSGTIRITNKNGFIQGTNALTVYVACYGDGSEPIGVQATARRAREAIGQRKTYHFFNQNCHMFTSGCIPGNLNNNDNLFIKLQNTMRQEYGSFNWRAWH